MHISPGTDFNDITLQAQDIIRLSVVGIDCTLIICTVTLFPYIKANNMPIYNIESSEVEQMCFQLGFESYNTIDSGGRIDCLIYHSLG